MTPDHTDASPDSRNEALPGPAVFKPRAKRGFILVFAGVALFAYTLLSPALPKEQHVRLMLGDGAPRVTRLSVSYGQSDAPLPARTVNFAFEPHQAPRVVAHDPELPNGRYLLRMEVISTAGESALEREVELSGKTVSVDLVPYVRTE